MISPHAAEVMCDSMADVPFCGVATDASNHLAVKMFTGPIQYFDWEKVPLQTKLLDMQSKQNGKVHTVAEYGHRICKETDFLEGACNFLVIIVT